MGSEYLSEHSFLDSNLLDDAVEITTLGVMIRIQLGRNMHQNDIRLSFQRPDRTSILLLNDRIVLWNVAGQ